MNGRLLFRLVLAASGGGLLAACGYDGSSTVNTQSIQVQRRNFRLVRETWGITDNHTNLYLLEDLPSGRADTIITQIGSNYSFFKANADTLFLYSPNIRRSGTLKRGRAIIKIIVLTNPVLMDLISADNFKKHGLRQI